MAASMQGLRVEHGTELAQQLAALWAATTQLRATVLALLQCGRPGEAQVCACHPGSHHDPQTDSLPARVIVAGWEHAREACH